MTQIKKAQAERNKTIIRTSAITIITNIMLAVFKGVIGIITHSISIVLDAVNNLSDAMSGVITIAGARLAVKQPDKKHPMGHGRIEYLSSMIVSGLVLYAGLTSIIESIKKIIDPSKPTFTFTSVAILAVFVVVKLVLSGYVVKAGKKVKSMSLVASGKDAGFDAVLSTSVLISIIVYIKTGILLEAWVGVLISVFIVKGGIEMMVESVDEIIGKRTDPELSKKIKASIAKEPEIFGAYDLLINTYGAHTSVGSVHIEVPDTMTVAELDEIERRVAGKILNEYGVLLSGIGIYSRNSQDSEIAAIESALRNKMKEYEGVIQMHGLYVNKKKKQMSFDIIISYRIKDRESLFERVKKDVQSEYPDYSIEMNMDIDL